MRIIEIFEGMDGEINPFGQGRIATFIRLAGCNLSCKWCDTKHAQDPNAGTFLDIDDILKRVQPITDITLTGGEPLYADNGVVLLEALLKNGHRVNVETNGSLPIPNYIAPHERCGFTVDIKMPSSGMFHRNLHFTMFLKGIVVFKMVVANESDTEAAMDTIKKIRATAPFVPIAVSPTPEMYPKVEYIVRNLAYMNAGNVFVSVQLHKILNLR